MSITSFTRLTSVAVALTLTGLSLTACAQPGDARGKPGSQPVVTLHFADANGMNPNGQDVAAETFLAALTRLSGDRLRIDVQQDFEHTQITAESDLIAAVRSGKLDGGWPATRGFAKAGIAGLAPLEAPLLLTSYDAERAIVEGAGNDAARSALKGTGLVGLGLTVGPLRRPWSNTVPLLDATSWKGITFRVYNSDVQTHTVTNLGGDPTSASYDFDVLVNAGKLHGVETDVAQYENRGYDDLMTYAAGNVVLWPRMRMFIINQKTFDSLTEDQRQWLQQAADEAARATSSFAYDDDAVATRLCDHGVRFVPASPAQVAALRKAVAPVNASLASDPATAPLHRAVAEAAAQHPTTRALRVPASCQKA